MELEEDYRRMSKPRTRCVVTIGSFDGLHLGHQLLLHKVLEWGAAASLAPAVLTFAPHPAKVLAPLLCPPLLMPLPRKQNAFAGLGIERVLAQRFDHEFAALPAETFVREVLCEGLGARGVVVGDDFSFGKSRGGLADDLVRYGKRHGFEVLVMRRLCVEGITASSTHIRAFLLQGNLRGASLLLGRPYVIEGEVVRGDGRGRTLGFPTVNLKAAAELIPPRGVYVCALFVPGVPLGSLAVCNIGVCPTFGLQQHRIEIHVPGQELPDLTGQRVAVGFQERLRPEHCFASAEALCQQIRVDIRDAARYVAENRPSFHLHPLDGFLDSRV